MTHRYLVLSDSHRATGVLEQILMAAEAGGKTDGVIHLGDGYDDLRSFERHLPPVIRVLGNCDRTPWNISQDQLILTAELNGVRVLATHGHMLGVRQGTDVLKARAMAEKCRVAMYGHTHTPLLKEEDGVLILNPGAAMDHHYAYLFIGDGGEVSAELH